MVHKINMEEIMYQKIIELLRIHGYLQKDTTHGPCYVKNIKGKNKCVYVIFDKHPDGSSILEEDLYELELYAKQFFGMECAVLILVLSQDEKPMFIDREDEFEDLYGPLSMILAQNKMTEEPIAASNELKNINTIKTFLYNYKATIGIFLLNLIGFILTEIYGDKLYDSFACNAYMVKRAHEYYRLLTSNYLHFGWDHFFNNMVGFLILGSSLEKVMGSIRYVILYTGAGIAGSMISVAYYSMMGQDVLSAGASGAIFGLVGALAAVFLFCKEQRQRFDGLGIFLMIAGSLYHGFQSGTTDNAAHIGGCIAGFILSMLLYVSGNLISARKQER